MTPKDRKFLELEDRVKRLTRQCAELRVMDRGGFMYKIGQAAIGEACEAIAKRRMG